MHCALSEWCTAIPDFSFLVYVQDAASYSSLQSSPSQFTKQGCWYLARSTSFLLNACLQRKNRPDDNFSSLCLSSWLLCCSQTETYIKIQLSSKVNMSNQTKNPNLESKVILQRKASHTMLFAARPLWRDPEPNQWMLLQVRAERSDEDRMRASSYV